MGMLGGHRQELEDRITKAGAKVFPSQSWDEDLLLKDEVLDRFSLGKKPETPLPNNHLSLLAMVDCWSQMGIVPYDHMICSTPLFRLWLGVTEYLFRKPALLNDVIRVAIEAIHLDQTIWNLRLRREGGVSALLLVTLKDTEIVFRARRSSLSRDLQMLRRLGTR